MTNTCRTRKNGRFDAYLSAITDLQQMDLMGFDYPHKDTIREALYLAVGAISNDGPLGLTASPVSVGEVPVSNQGTSGGPSIPAGWRLVPENPTEDMIEKTKCLWGVDQSTHKPIYGNQYGMLNVWRTMLAAAPQPEETSNEQ